ncbi:hypothetical protein ACFVYN_40050, partial [Streptomyces sp. NPDC058307]
MAREALREARRRRAEAETAEAETALARRSRRTAPTASPDRKNRNRTPSPTAGARARDVRELLADVFRMPDDDATRPGEERADNSLTQQGSSLPGIHAPDGGDGQAPTVT